jgi:hypothetical protein
MRANSSLRALPSGILLSERSWLDEMERRGISRRTAIAMSIQGTLADGTAVSGDAVATHAAGGKEHQVVMVAGPDGHLQDTLPTYYFWSGFAAGAANQKVLSIFNAVGSAVKVKLKKIFIQSNMAAATHVGQVFEFRRSTSVGTGGTGITGEKADSTNANIPAAVTAMARPTGGAAAGALLWAAGLDGEETRPAAGLLGMINWVPEGPNIQEPVLNAGEGFYVQQITSSITTLWGALFVVSIS